MFPLQFFIISPDVMKFCGHLIGPPPVLWRMGYSGQRKSPWLTTGEKRLPSNIPYARVALENACKRLRSGHYETEQILNLLETALAMMTRSPPVRRAPEKSRPVTEKLVKEIKSFASDNPRAHMSEIAQRFKVNQGRVSEVLSGRREG